MASIYGFFPDNETVWREEKYRRVFAYLKAKIDAEKINPEEDYDREIHIAILSEIATSDLDFWRRRELVNLLKQEEDNE